MSAPRRIEPAPPPAGIDWIGPVAARLLEAAALRPTLVATREPSGLGVVAAVFERSIWIESEGAFICIGQQGIGRGPLNATVAQTSGSKWLQQVRDGEPVRIAAAGISAAAWRVDCSQAREWQPRPWPEPASPAQLAKALAEVKQYAARKMPSDGLYSLAMARTDRTISSALGRLAAPRIAAFQRWLEAPAANPPAIELMGLGPGLTPSGDDFLCGALLALDALQAQSTRVALAAALQEGALRLTTPLSAAFLAAAAEGYGSEALHRFIAALVGGDLAALPQTTSALVRIGHTSGWDALAGAALVVSAALPRPGRSTRFP